MALVVPPRSMTSTNLRRLQRLTGRDWRNLAEQVAAMPAGFVSRFHEDGCDERPCSCMPLSLISGGCA